MKSSSREDSGGQAIRLDVEEGIDERLLKIIEENLNISEEEIYRINGPLDLSFLMKCTGCRTLRI